MDQIEGVKEIIKKDSKILDLSNWKDGFVIYWDKEGCSQIKKGSCWDGEENQELSFEDNNFEMPARLQVGCQAVGYANLELKREFRAEISIFYRPVVLNPDCSGIKNT